MSVLGQPPETWVLSASIVVSIIIASWFFLAWWISNRFGAPGTYLLWYGIYLVAANVPILVMGLFKIEQHGYLSFVFETVTLLVCIQIARGWCEKRTGAWWFFPPGIVVITLHNVTESQWVAVMWGLLLALLFAYTCLCVSKHSPWWIVLGVAISYSGWAAYYILFRHPGDPIGHSMAMVVKVAMFGSVIIAHYERQHRELFAAAYFRKAAIEIYTGDVTDIKQVEVNSGGRNGGPSRFQGLATSH